MCTEHYSAMLNFVNMQTQTNDTELNVYPKCLVLSFKWKQQQQQNFCFGSHGLILYLCNATCSRELSGDVCLVNILLYLCSAMCSRELSGDVCLVNILLYLCNAMCSRELSGDVCLVNILPIESFASSLFLYWFILDVLETITNTLACIALWLILCVCVCAQSPECRLSH